MDEDKLEMLIAKADRLLEKNYLDEDDIPALENVRQKLTEIIGGGSNYHALDRRAQLSIRLSDFDSAIADYERLVDEGNVEEHPLFPLCNLYELTRNYSKVIALNSKLREEKDVHIAEIVAFAGLCHLHLGDSETSLRELVQGHKDFPNEPTMIANRAIVHIQEEQYDAAIDLIEEKNDMFDSQTYPFRAMTHALYYIGEYDRALSAYNAIPHADWMDNVIYCKTLIKLNHPQAENEIERFYDILSINNELGPHTHSRGLYLAGVFLELESSKFSHLQFPTDYLDDGLMKNAIDLQDINNLMADKPVPYLTPGERGVLLHSAFTQRMQ